VPARGELRLFVPEWEVLTVLEHAMAAKSAPLR
jgi:hypothetical protein